MQISAVNSGLWRSGSASIAASRFIISLFNKAEKKNRILFHPPQEVGEVWEVEGGDVIKEPISIKSR